MYECVMCVCVCVCVHVCACLYVSKCMYVCVNGLCARVHTRCSFPVVRRFHSYVFVRKMIRVHVCVWSLCVRECVCVCVRGIEVSFVCGCVYNDLGACVCAGVRV